MTRTEQFIHDNRKLLTSGPDFYNPDTSLMPKEKFYTSKCKFLLIFPTPHVTKTISSTAAALNDYIIEHCPDTFIDFAYMPEGEDIARYDKANVPYAIGNITHLDASHFDLVGFSISVLNEVVTAPVILNTFSRCDKPIPLFWSDRKDLPIGSCPVIYAGGITAVCGESMFGKVKVGDQLKQAYIDFMYLGDCGQTHHITNRLIEALSAHQATRHPNDRDVPGYVHEELPNFQEVVPVNTIQEYVESLFDLTEVYQPQAYEVTYNKDNMIISNKKINPKARDFVRPYYPHTMSEDLGIGRTIIAANGDGNGTTQTQGTEGAMCEGTLIRTDVGLVPVETLCQPTKGNSAITESVFVDTTSGKHSLYHQYNQGIKPYRKFILRSGITISLTDEHPVEQWHLGDTDTSFVRADSLRVGDFLMTKKSHVFGNYPMTTDEAEFLGRMLGDGFYDLCQGSNAKFDYSEHHMYLTCPWYDVTYCEDLLKRASISYTKDDSNTLYYRFWISEVDLKGRSMQEFWTFNQHYQKDITNTSIKYIPAAAFSLNEACMKSFLKGYHDSSACTPSESCPSLISFDSPYESIINTIQQLLLMVGIPTIKSFGTKSQNTHALWYLSISSEHFTTFNALGVHKKAPHRSKSSNEILPINESSREYLNTHLKSLKTPQTLQKYHSFVSAVRKGLFTKAMADDCHISYPKDIVFDQVVGIDYGEGNVYDLSVSNVAKLTANGISIHNCSAGGSCSFCAEGNYTGGEIEKTHERMIEEVREAKKYSAGYKYKMYSFNMNYITDYKGLLAKLVKEYPKVTFINMRMEELGKDPDALRLMKVVGSQRISAPCEGLSPRIQNNLLNKCLSEESLNAFMEEMVHARMTDIKCGSIFTSYEQDEDFQWMCDFVDKFKQKAAKEGGNFPFRLKCCATGDTLTPVQGKGLVRNSSLQTSDVVEGYVASNIIATQPQGVSEIVTITTDLGTILEVTPNHPILTYHRKGRNVKESDYTQAQNLQEGDKVIYRVGTQAFADAPTISKLDASFAALCITRAFINSQNNVHIPLLYREASLLDNIIQVYHFKVDEANQVVIPLSDFPLNDSLHNGMFTHIPDSVLTSTRECQVEFLKYLFNESCTHIGSINYGKKSLSYFLGFEHRSHTLLRDLQSMLFNFGIVSKISTTKTSYVLIIDNDYIQDLIVEGVIEDLPRYFKRNKTPEFFAAHVTSVIKTTKKLTYGLEVKGTHSYVTNGILSHNTPLVHYPLTPIEYLERKSARKSYNQEHWLTDEWYEKFREHEVYFKTNGFRYSTFLEQTLVDLGRSLTPMIYHHFIKENVPVYSLRSLATEEYIANLKSFINPDTYFADRPIESYISPCHRIHIELQGSYMQRARRLLRNKAAGNIFNNEPDTRCLKTREDAPTKCYSKACAKDPIHIYNDVTLVDGHLEGEYRDLKGCERCQTKEERLSRLARKIISTADTDKVIGIPRIPQTQKVRFVIQRLPAYDVLNPNNTAHTALSKVLQASDELLDNYHSISVHSEFWQADPQFKYYTSGLLLVDTLWNKSSYKLIKELIPQVNKTLTACKIVDAYEIPKEDKLLISDWNIFSFSSSIPREIFSVASQTYKGEIKVQAQVQGFQLTQTNDPSLIVPLFFSKQGKTQGVLAIPAKYNPVIFLSSFLSVAKKTSEDQVVTTTEFQSLMTIRDTKVAARDGKGYASFNLTSNKQLPFGKETLLKLLYKQLSSK